MKLKRLLVSGLLLAVLIASAAAQAQHRGHHQKQHHHQRGGVQLGIVIGAPLMWHYRPVYPAYPAYYSPYAYPPYAYAPRVIVPAAPPVYVERQDVVVSGAGQDDWYYCADSRTYYPYVQQCAGGWQRVTPHPPARY